MSSPGRFEISRLRTLALSSSVGVNELAVEARAAAHVAASASTPASAASVSASLSPSSQEMKIGDLASLERFATGDARLARIVQEKRDEDKLRSLFAQQPDNDAIRDPHVLLRSLYPSAAESKGKKSLLPNSARLVAALRRVIVDATAVGCRGDLCSVVAE